MLKQNRRTLATVGVVVALGLAGAGVAQAGTTNVAYSTTVGASNGSGYTAYQTQSTTGAAAQLHSTTVGGKYVVDARVQGPQNGAWARNVTDNDSRLLSNLNASGKSVRIQFSNNLNTPVAVQVSGTWRSN